MPVEVTDTDESRKDGIPLIESLQKVSPQLAERAVEEIRKGLELEAQKGKYKIQILFHSKRSDHNPMTWAISFWESGKRLHGGGDEMMFICRRHSDAKKIRPPMEAVTSRVVVTPTGCDGLISGGIAQLGTIVCPTCGSKHETDQIADSLHYHGDANKCAQVLEYWWRKLDCNADLYAKYRSDDPRTMLMAKTYGVWKAKQKKGLTIYPLPRIMADLNAGASALNRFKAFVTA